MILIALVKIIIIFPFLIDWLLAWQKLSKKRRSFMLTPLYLVTTILFFMYIFKPIIGLILFALSIAAFVIYVVFIVRRKYRRVYFQYIVRNFLEEYYEIFPKIYLLLLIVGSLYLSFSGNI